jgi:hypothetical protein
MRSPLYFTATTFAAQAVALPTGDGGRGNGKAAYEQETQRRADAVKAAFQTAWDGYYECASYSWKTQTKAVKLTVWVGTRFRMMSSLRWIIASATLGKCMSKRLHGVIY